MLRGLKADPAQSDRHPCLMRADQWAEARSIGPSNDSTARREAAHVAPCAGRSSATAPQVSKLPFMAGLNRSITARRSRLGQSPQAEIGQKQTINRLRSAFKTMLLTRRLHAVQWLDT